MSKSSQEVVKFIVETITQSSEAKVQETIANAQAQTTENTTKEVNDFLSKLEGQFNRDKEDIEKNTEIRKAQIQNNVKLEILKSQTEALHEALKDAIEKLNQFSEKPEYKELLQNLIAEGLDRLKETRVHLMVRKKDLQLAQEVLSKAVEIAENANPGLKIQAKIDTTRFLPQPPQCAGGVVLLCQKGKIRVSNVLNDRLRLAYEALLPRIRRIVLDDNTSTISTIDLFGEQKSDKESKKKDKKKEEKKDKKKDKKKEEKKEEKKDKKKDKKK